jgi:predicted lipoprotein with Yx(FWY)xxD motif
MNCNILFVAVFCMLSSALQAASLTRPVKVVEGLTSHLYLGTNFGQTLYTFDLDKNGQSACTQACAEKWPPLLVNADEAATLFEPFGTIERASGLLQVIYHGKPIYTFYLDHTEGDNKGDGLGGVWHDIDYKETGSTTP